MSNMYTETYKGFKIQTDEYKQAEELNTAIDELTYLFTNLKNIEIVYKDNSITMRNRIHPVDMPYFWWLCDLSDDFKKYQLEMTSDHSRMVLRVQTNVDNNLYQTLIECLYLTDKLTHYYDKLQPKLESAYYIDELNLYFNNDLDRLKRDLNMVKNESLDTRVLYHRLKSEWLTVDESMLTKPVKNSLRAIYLLLEHGVFSSEEDNYYVIKTDNLTLNIPKEYAHCLEVFDETVAEGFYQLAQHVKGIPAKFILTVEPFNSNDVIFSFKLEMSVYKDDEEKLYLLNGITEFYPNFTMTDDDDLNIKQLLLDEKETIVLNEKLEQIQHHLKYLEFENVTKIVQDIMREISNDKLYKR